MRTSRSLLGLTLIALLTFSGCWSKDFREPEVVKKVKKSKVEAFYSRSFSDVWDATTTSLTEKKYAISVTQRDKGVIISDWISGQSDRLFSGYGDTRIPYKVRSKLTIHLTLRRGGIRVTITNHEQYISDAITLSSDFKGSLYSWIDTPSSGAKEKAILQAIGRHLKLRTSKGKKK